MTYWQKLRLGSLLTLAALLLLVLLMAAREEPAESPNRTNVTFEF
ncbi:MAG TPA: hypothetical protein VMF89_30865 [Polyangiales bacterium]|nr:hypothetical protein [Polyangiales bacterium]